MISFILRTAFSILLMAAFLANGSTASAQLANRSPAAVVEVSAQTLAAQEQELITEIDRQAEVIFQEIKRQQPELPVTIVQKTQREAVYRLKQMHVLTDVLKAAGPTPAVALVAAEVLTTFILAPMFAAKGNVVMATLMVTVPWGIAAGAAAASYEMVKHRLKIARDLKAGFWSLHQADKIREIVLGYDVKYRISTVMFESMKESLAKDLEFEVVKKMKTAELARAPFVTVAELDALIRNTPEGALFLGRIYFERLDRELYSALMLRYLNDHPVLVEKLLELLESRTPAVPIEAALLRKHLLAVDDLKKLIARDLMTIQIELKASKKKVKSGEMTKEAADQSKLYLKQEIKRLQVARGDVIRHEYALLLDAKSAFNEKDFAAVDGITSDYARTLAKLRG
ncbi:MAG: hypothetical protein AAB250_19825, partial [Bdellovibrionota bacterium]